MNEASKKNENSQNEPEPIQPLAERLAEVEGVDEDIAQIIANNWQQVVIGVVVIVLTVWGINEYRSSNNEALEKSSKQYVEAQKIFSEAKNQTAEEPISEQQLVAMQEKFKSLGQSTENVFYAKSSQIYTAIDLLKNEKVDEAIALLKGFPIQKYESKQQTSVAPGDIDLNILDEFAALLYAKALLAKGEENIESARNYLIGLAYRGNLLNTEALVTLARISIEPNHRKETEAIAHDVSVGRPELADSIESSISPYGFSATK